MSVSTLRTHVLAVKERLAAGREKIEARHRKGSPGIQVCWALSDLLDTLVLELFETALSDLGQDGPDGLRGQVALVPHGGYGRRDVAPYSDVDLMILHTSAARSQVVPLAERMVRDLFDAGMNLGQSVRTPAEACRLARKDATICTSLVEARYLAGSVKVYRKFASTFQKQARRHGWSLLRALEKARLDERVQYGETVYLLEPNVKRSPGGLRDIQLLRWIGFVRYETPEPDGLRLRGVLSWEDYEAVRRALEFLLRLRNEMHFHARKSSDVLDRVEQVRLAELFGYQGSEGLLPVEQFMRDYFRLTNDVSNLVSRFQKSARRRSRLVEWLAMIFSHQFEQDFRVGPTHITANQRGLAKLRGNLAEILRLADYANHDDKVIAHETRETIRAAVPELDDTLSSEAQERFLSLLSRPARLGELLRDLHSMGVLEKVIPAFRHARCLLQFNEYHKYTVDEHCLRAVEQAAEFQRDTGPVGWVYRHIKRKWLLHLALLLHDLGKGHAEDHSEVGLRIADDTARRLGLVERDAETLRFLVHKHLLMSYLAFRRDTSDEALVVRFAVEVGSPETLQMLFVLTAADLAAVGPGVLNAWKVEVLADLHRRAMQHLAGEAPAISPREHLQSLRDEVLPLVPEEGRSWFKTQLAALPVSYLRASRSGQVAEDLIRLRRLSRGDAIALGRFQPETGTVEYKVGTYEDITPGVFHKLTGALAGRGLRILSAEIHTLADGLVFDRFFVHDPDFSGEPPPARLDEVSRALVASLKASGSQPPTFRRLWRAGEQRRQSALSPLPMQVRVDNATSDRFTIIDVFAADRTGLLYTIARALFQSGLSVSVAKIGTYLDQVVDVFYVTDQAGRKLEDERRLGELRDRLLWEIEQLERQEAAAVGAR